MHTYTDVSGASTEIPNTFARTIEANSWKVGMVAPPGRYFDVDTGREVILDREDHLPATCDGRVAHYRRAARTWGELPTPATETPAAAVPAPLAVSRTYRDASAVARRFAERCTSHRTDLYHLALAFTRNANDAEDLVQTTLLRACQRSHTFRDQSRQSGYEGTGDPPGSALRAWLFAILRNTFFNEHRRKSYRPRTVSLESDFDTYEERTSSSTSGGNGSFGAFNVSRNDPVFQDMVWREFSRDVAGAMERLPPHYRRVVILAVMQGLSYEEIAEQMSLPVGTVRSRIHRARTRLSRLLCRWGPENRVSVR
ncbi:MAG: hypothetical protein OHK0029_13740 [Armatimonadaceae bacterium]